MLEADEYFAKTEWSQGVGSKELEGWRGQRKTQWDVMVTEGDKDWKIDLWGKRENNEEDVQAMSPSDRSVWKTARRVGGVETRK